MGQVPRIMVTAVLLLLVMLSAFFQSILMKIGESKEGKIYYLHTLIQIIYALTISFSSGLAVSFIINIIINYKYKSINSGITPLLWIPCIIAILLIWIIILNYKNLEFNLPKSIITTCYLILNLNWKVRFLETVVSMVLMPLILSFLFLKLISCYVIPNTDGYSMFIITLILSFIICLLIFSEVTKDKLTKLARQFILWGLLFIGISLLTLTQIIGYAASDGMSKNVVSILFSIIGLVFIFPTIIGISNSLFDEAYSKKKSEVQEYLNEIVSKYSISRVNNFFRIKLDIFKKCVYITKFLWITAQKGKIFKMVTTLFLCLIIYCNFVRYGVKYDSLIPHIQSVLWGCFVGKLNNNEELSKSVFYASMLGGGLILCIIMTVRNFKQSTLYRKTIYIMRVFGLILLEIVMVDSIATGSIKKYLSIMIIPIFLIIVVLMMILKYLEKIKM